MFPEITQMICNRWVSNPGLFTFKTKHTSGFQSRWYVRITGLPIKIAVAQAHLQTKEIKISGGGTQAWVFLFKAPNHWLEK